MTWLRGAWKWLLPAWIAIGAAMYLVAPEYAQVQGSASADAFRATLDRDARGNYTAAAVLDQFFAVAYALLAVSAALNVNPLRQALARLARAGAGMVVVAAVIDFVENVLVLRNIANYDSVTDGAIEQMSSLAPGKWGLGLAGATVVIVALVAGRRGKSA